MEFIRDSRSVGPGEEGEIVCTVLNNYTIPLIRYNLHDIGGFTTEVCLTVAPSSS
jgi:phenylacetate-coenzyme A ligase PaaK-like adenylate-forming protein